MTNDDPAVLVDALETAIRLALAPLVKRIRELETAVADVGALREKTAALEAFVQAFNAGAEPPTE